MQSCGRLEIRFGGEPNASATPGYVLRPNERGVWEPRHATPLKALLLAHRPAPCLPVRGTAAGSVSSTTEPSPSALGSCRASSPSLPCTTSRLLHRRRGARRPDV